MEDADACIRLRALLGGHSGGVGRNVDLDPKSVEVPRYAARLARDRLQRQAELDRHRLPHARAARYLLGEPSTHEHKKRY